MAEVTGIKRKGEESAYSTDFCHTNRAASFWTAGMWECAYIFQIMMVKEKWKMNYVFIWKYIWKLTIVFLST